MVTATTDVERGVLEIRPMSDREFRAFRDLIYNESGIHLAEQKRELLSARLARRLRVLGIDRYGDYLSLVRESVAERTEMFDRVSTNETQFFREPKQFEYLESAVLPGLVADGDAGRRPRSIRAWSAGCSTGEEPYSIAMTLIAALSGWEIEVLATDISTRALSHAVAGVWPVESVREVPRHHLERFMLRGVRSNAGRVRVTDALRSAVRFQRYNLHDEHAPDIGRFDLVFCRNVLIYFDRISRGRALRRICGKLDRGGRLFLGHSESLIGFARDIRAVAPSVYQLVPDSGEEGERR